MEHFVKTENNKCLLSEYEEDAILSFLSLDFTITLQDIYRGIEFNLNEE